MSGCNFSSGRFKSLSNEIRPLGYLGRGSCSNVYSVLHVPSLRIVAQKIMTSDKHKFTQVIQELHALRAWRHQPNLVETYDAWTDPDEGSVSMLTEYLNGGSLQAIVESGGCPCGPLLANIACRILSGLVHLHGINQFHRDIKPSNLLVNHLGDVKINDFGITRTCTGMSAMTFIGTVSYMSPERILGENYDIKSDIWSFGLTLMTCTFGDFPYKISRVNRFWDLLRVLREDVPENPPNKFSAHTQDFVLQCMHRAPAARPSAADLSSHPFVAECSHKPMGVLTTAPGKNEIEICGAISKLFDQNKFGLIPIHYLLPPDNYPLIYLVCQTCAPYCLSRLWLREHPWEEAHPLP